MRQLAGTSLGMLENAAPAAPEAALRAIEASLRPTQEAVALWRGAPAHRVATDVLLALAYDPALFDRAVQALATLARAQEPNSRNDSVSNGLFGLFALYLSGTEAMPEQRARVVEAFLDSADPVQVELGLGMLERALKDDHRSLPRESAFGARPRSYGWQPRTGADGAAWFALFLDLAKARMGRWDTPVRTRVRGMIVDGLRSMWRWAALRPRLTALVREWSAQEPWNGIWRAVKAKLWYDYRGASRERDREGFESLEKLEVELRPQDRLGEIRAFVLETDSAAFTLLDEVDHEDPERFTKGMAAVAARARDLGRAATMDAELLGTVLPEMVRSRQGRVEEFGRGLAEAATDLDAVWTAILDAVEGTADGNCNVGVGIGVLQEVASVDIERAHALVEAALAQPISRRFAILWQSVMPIDGRGMVRLRTAIEEAGDALPLAFGTILWGRDFQRLDEPDRADLLRRALAKPLAHRMLRHDAAGMTHRSRDDLPLGSEMRELTREVARRCMADPHEARQAHMWDYDLGQILRVCLDPEGAPEKAAEVLAEYVSQVRAGRGYCHELDEAGKALAEGMPGAFLDAVLTEGALTPETRGVLLRGSHRGSHLLGTLPVETMLAWLAVDPPARARLLAGVVPVFTDGESDAADRLTGLARALLEAAPDPEDVVVAFIFATPSMSGSGSGAEVIARRRAALTELLVHPSDAIRSAVACHLPTLEEMERRERESELAWAWEHDQRFE